MKQKIIINVSGFIGEFVIDCRNAGRYNKT